MKSESFHFVTRLDVDPQTVFTWHERPGAFEALSPPWMDVKVLERSGGIEEGGQVKLQIGCGPLKLFWQLEHCNFVKGQKFEDMQVSGPFEEYHHLHDFRPDGNNWGCILEDTIEFRLPLPSLPGYAIARMFKSELRRMFAYRKEVLRQQLSIPETKGKAMQVAVSGSHGLVGSALIPLLTTHGHQVRRLVREPVKPGSADIYWRQSPDWNCAESLRGVDAIVHLAGESIASGRWTDAKKKAIMQSRVGPTRSLCEAIAAMDNPPRVLVCASAIGYYGDCGDKLVDEASPGDGGFLGEVCSEWERATEIAAKAGVRVVNLRLGIVLSPRDGALAKMLPPFVAGAGGPFGNGQQYMSWVAIDDVAGAILHCLTNDSLSGPVNVAAPHPVTNAEFTKTLGKVLHRPTMVPVPAFGARLLFGEMADALLLSSTRVKPSRLLSSGYKFSYAELEPALRHLLGR